MKTTIVPAQVTTVEDKIAGNLSFTQLMLLVTPIFLNGVVFVLFPPVFKFSFLKLLTGATITLLCATLAIRLKGKILLSWIVVIMRYKARPTYYLFNKNSLYLRLRPIMSEPEEVKMPEILPDTLPVTRLIPTNQIVRAETAIADPRAKFHVRVKKGGLHVYIREVKEENV